MDGRPDLLRRSAAEGIGAFALVFAGCGAIVTDAVHEGVLGAVGVSLVFGLVIMAMVYATGHLSGAHLNPAVTLAFALTRHFPHREAAAYVGAQLLGALAAAALLLAVWPSEPASLGATVPSVGVGSALVYEAVLTAFLISGELHDAWIYIVAPIAGAALGALAYQLVRGTQAITRRRDESGHIPTEIGPSAEVEA